MRSESFEDFRTKCDVLIILELDFFIEAQNCIADHVISVFI